VASVEVSIKNTDTGLWWNSRSGTWLTTQAWNQAAASGTSITNMIYGYTFNGAAYNGHYHAEVRATDISAIGSATIPTVDFSTAGSPGDQLTPVTSITAPVIDATVPVGPVTFQGSAGDNVGVTQVQVSIMDRNTNRMFDPGTGTFVNGPKIWIPGTVATPGALETTWTYVFSGGAAGSGSYYVISRGLDAAGNIQTDSPFTRYTVAGVSDTVAPDTTITAPTPGQAVPSGTVGIAGNATDNVGVASVAVSIRDDGSNLWWNGSAWVGSQQWLAASIFSPGGPSTGWSYSWASPGPGAYTAFARSTDAGANVDGSPASSAFTVLPADTTVPTATISSPVNNSSANPPIATSGTAADDAGVAAVRVAIRDNATLLWWNGTGWGAAGSFVIAALDTPGGTSTGWSYPFDPGVAGNYGIQVKSVDTSGNVGVNTAWRNFNVTIPGSDTTGPTIALTTPTSGQSLPFGSVNVSGTSSDATGVASIRVSIQNSTTLQWWNGSGWVAATTFVNASLDTPGGTSTAYSYTFSPGVEGSYAVQVRGVDTIGNLGTTIGPRPFTIRPVFVDTTAPTTTVTAPLNLSTNPAPVVMTGTATDDIGVTVVRVSIKNAANQWWNGSTWGAFTFVTAVLDNPGGTSTGWTYTFIPPPATGYGFQARALDAAANLGANTVWRTFAVS
jgi:trimeric autotransporter adhesin